MTDVTVAPASAPASAPQPAQSEVPINQNPVSSPNPIGPQAPPAPTGDIKGSEHRPQSRREAIQAAFDRASTPHSKTAKPVERPAPKPAEARKGHNQPPEDVPDEKFDLRKPPRGERGQFAPRAQNRAEPAQNSANSAQMSANSAQMSANTQTQLPPHAPYQQPPQRFAEHAKRDWGSTPESVRGELHRMQTEFVKAYNVFKGDFEAFKPVKRYHALAQEQGTTLEKVLDNFTGIEHKLRADPIAGLDVIVRNLGLKTQDGGPAGLRDIAYTILSQTPEQLKQVQQGNVQQAANYQIGALHQEISALKQTLNQMHTDQQFVYTRSAIDQFAETHPRFDELGVPIERELKLGFDIETAYRRAELLHPATHAAQTRTQSAQTRTPDRSIHGSPDVAPSNGASRRPKEASRSPRDAVQNALNRVGGVH